ncbi:MAG: ADP-ribosylglycohydrolase family protein [Clostridia bacterium]|nr:ADP-ribosylglycohydrolase family protein [Clostridia bacterium]
MSVNEMIYKLRTKEKLSQEQFADLFKVTRQSVQKWENGISTPELSKLIEISKYFGISLDALILNRDRRVIDEMKYDKAMKPNYSNIHNWEFYASDIMIEYEQSLEEGLDIEAYNDLFSAIAKLPKNEIKKNLGDIIFKIVKEAKPRADYKYIEPSDLEGIKALRKEYTLCGKVDKKGLKSKIHGAWLGRICGCMLGKSIEGIRTNELVSFLKETDNYPMHRYIYRSDLNDEICGKYNFPLASRPYADEIEGMPIDDDTNYVVLAQIIIEKYGKSFTPYDISRAWLEFQPKDAYCTAERVAFCNFVKGYEPPQSAVYKNPYREWIGAQIRGDYFGYINPGNPEMAAEMAWRDASISHVKNGIYGEMFVSAMLAAAAVTNNIKDIILTGLSQIPHTSRLYEDISTVLEGFEKGVTQKKAFDNIHKKYDEYSSHGWCHTNSNAMIVAASLLYGEGNYGKSICMAVETGFDTDCNGATVGSVLGMANGVESIPEYWTKPINDTLHTSVFGVGTVKISDRVKMTMKHIN